MAKACIDAGIEERWVAVVEENARQVSQLIRAVLADLQIPLDENTTKVVRRHLQLVSGREG